MVAAVAASCCRARTTAAAGPREGRRVCAVDKVISVIQRSRTCRGVTVMAIDSENMCEMPNNSAALANSGAVTFLQ